MAPGAEKTVAGKDVVLVGGPALWFCNRQRYRGPDLLPGRREGAGGGGVCYSTRCTKGGNRGRCGCSFSFFFCPSGQQLTQVRGHQDDPLLPRRRTHAFVDDVQLCKYLLILDRRRFARPFAAPAWPSGANTGLESQASRLAGFTCLRTKSGAARTAAR